MDIGAIWGRKIAVINPQKRHKLIIKKYSNEGFTKNAEAKYLAM